MDSSRPGSSVHGTSQARKLEWAAISFSRESSQPRDWTHISCIGSWILCWWATKEILHRVYLRQNIRFCAFKCGYVSYTSIKLCFFFMKSPCFLLPFLLHFSPQSLSSSNTEVFLPHHCAYYQYQPPLPSRTQVLWSRDICLFVCCVKRCFINAC